MASYLETARHALEAVRRSDAAPCRRASGLKGTALEIWAEAAGGRVWIVTDEEDAKLARERFNASRGETWTSEEIELVARIEDRALAQEVAAWKQRFNRPIKDGTKG